MGPVRAPLPAGDYLWYNGPGARTYAGAKPQEKQRHPRTDEASKKNFPSSGNAGWELL